MQMHLLFSGLLLSSTHPVHELEVEDVIRQAEVSRGSFYNYFPSLPALYDGLAKQLMHEFGEIVDSSIPQGLDTVSRLASTMRILMRLAVDYPMLGRFLTQIQWPNQNSDSEIFENIIRNIQIGIKDRVFADMPASIGSNIAIGSLIGGIHTMLLKRPAKGFEDQVTNQVLIGLGVDSKSASNISKITLPARPALPETGIFGKLAGMGALAKK
jgi:AcrR family transcriptional regulator